MTMGAGNLPDPLLLPPPIIRQDLQKSSGNMVANGKKLMWFFRCFTCFIHSTQ